jgi:DNA repair protein RadC
MKLSEIQVSYSTNSNKPQITTSINAYELFKENWNMDTIQLFEEFKILLLNRNNTVLGIYSLSKGGIAGTVVDIKLILAISLKCAASSIILGHNHPSGNLRPSKQDIALTKQVNEACILVDLKLLDHLIISSYGYYSFVDEGRV